jgi:hypothetical protein
MKKKFNDTGLCIPERHYMADTSEKIAAILKLVEDGSYFVINRPRQYGKTTTLYLLELALQKQEDYFPMFISFEGFGSESYHSEQRFIEALLSEFRSVFRFYKRDDLLALIKDIQNVLTLRLLNEWITEFVNKVEKRIVLMIDEVDKSSNNQLFLDFLALLRTKYLSAARGRDTTFHSIILAGVHDVKSLKLKIRPDEEKKYNSPWNIAVNFTVDMSFNPKEIQAMLIDYTEETSMMMHQKEIAEKLYYYTSGYPFLVSKLCKIIDEEFMPLSQENNVWLPEFVDEAVNKLLMIQNTNFESLIKNLENNPELYELVEQIVLFDKQIKYNEDNPLISLGLLYGIFICRENIVEIHNRIYRERIYNYMTSNLEIQTLIHTRLSDYNFQDNFILADGSLDVEKVLLKFQEFMKHQYSERDTPFIERNGRLIFLAFLKPIINGRGYDFKEPQISEEKQLDVVITYGAHKYIIELKIWRGETAHQKGLRQLHDYLERSGVEKGDLIIFDFTQKGQKKWQQEQIQVEDKEIFAVWV